MLSSNPAYVVTPQPEVDARGIGLVQPASIRYARAPRVAEPPSLDARSIEAHPDALIHLDV
jgi:hypothetical protein